MARRWPDGVACPPCGSAQFTIKTGTIFEDSPLGLDQWLIAMWMVINCKSAVGIRRDILTRRGSFSPLDTAVQKLQI